MSWATQLRLVAESSAPILIDVRTEYEFVGYHLPNAINIPYDEVEHYISQLLAVQNPIWVYSTYGMRSRIAAAKLKSAGVLKVEATTIDQLESLLAANPPSISN